MVRTRDESGTPKARASSRIRPRRTGGNRRVMTTELLGREGRALRACITFALMAYTVGKATRRRGPQKGETLVLWSALRARQALRGRGLTVYRLAKRLDGRQQQLSALKKLFASTDPRRRIQRTLLERIAKVLMVPPAWLRGERVDLEPGRLWVHLLGGRSPAVWMLRPAKFWRAISPKSAPPRAR